MDSRTISELAMCISDNTKIVDQYLTSVGSPESQLDDEMQSLPPIPSSQRDVLGAKEAVILATEQLNRKMRGPAETLSLGLTSSLADLLEVQFIQRFRIANLVPIGASTTYAQLSDETGLATDDLERILKRAQLNQLFQEKDGRISHTAASKFLAERGAISNLADLFTEEAWPSFAKVAEAMDNSKGSSEEQTGFSLANNTTDGMYAHLAKHPARMARFARAMEAFAAYEDFSYVVNAIDWFKVISVVDVGGAFGPCSIDLARAYPHLRLVVEDFDDVVKEGATRLPAELQDQIRFEAHDMFQTQSCKHFDVYIFCSIFHNWSDAKCADILKAHIPALKTGSQVIVLDWGLATAATTSAMAEKKRRTMDLTMLAFFRGKERCYSDWEKLIAEVDTRLEIISTESLSPIIHMIWTG